MSCIDARLSAEFHLHRCTYLLWPTRPDNWRDNARRGQASIATLANLLAEHEPVVIGYPADTDPRLNYSFVSGVTFREMAYEDIWVRDTGPLVVRGGTEGNYAVDFRFNSWGGLFNSSSKDDAVAGEIAAFEGFKVRHSELVLEGGAIISDGKGTIITTEESLIAENRNPGKSREQIEHEIRRMMYVDQFIWLPQGLAHDEAGGHVDNVCAFVDEQTLLVAETNDRGHPSYHRLKEVHDILASRKSIRGDSYRLVMVPLPPQTEITSEEASGFAQADGTIRRQKGTPLAPSHINSYVANGLVVVPTFGLASDNEASKIIAEAFRGRRTVQFLSREFLLGGGGVHCLTKDIAAA